MRATIAASTRPRRRVGLSHRLGDRIGDVRAQDVGAETHGGKNAFARESGMRLEELLDRLAGTKLLEDRLDSNTSVLYNRLAHHHCGIRTESLRGHLRTPPWLTGTI